MLAVDAALKAKALKSARGTRAKWVRWKLNTKIPSRKKLGIATKEHQIRKDSMHRAAVQTDSVQVINCPKYPWISLLSGNLTQPPLWAA
jgi:hypothetical protein